MQEKLPHVQLYSDGGAAPNPGKAGYGIILVYKNVKKEFFQGYMLSTNNRMEMSGVIAGLQKLTKKSKVDIYTDSQYTINGIEKGWAKKWQSNNWMRTASQKAINHDLWEILLNLVEKHEVIFHWVKGHAGHIENERCDDLATLALQGDDLIIDTGFTPALEEIQKKLNIEEVNIPQKNSKKTNSSSSKILSVGDICGRCNSPVIKKIPKKKKLKPEQKFYYEYFLYCPSCKSNYMVESGKRIV